MFEDSLAVSAASATPQRRWIVITSFTAQAAVVAALIIIPLLHPLALAPRALEMPLALPPVPPPVPPTPPPAEPVHVRVVDNAPSAVTAPPTNRAIIDRTVAINEPAGPEPPSTGGPINMGSSSSPFPIGIGSPSSGPHISVGTGGGGNGSGGPHGTPRLSTGVSVGLLINAIQPIYPAIAKAAGVSGTVNVEATISTTGKIESAHAVSGPVMLQGAAVEAVRNARYRPFMLNGQPTEVAASFTINFRMNGN